MSAFIVSDNTINKIVSYAAIKRLSAFGMEVKGNEQKIGQRFLDENYRSVNYRYKEKKTPRVYKFKMDYSTTLVEFVKNIHCLNYQSCETDDWKQTPENEALHDFLYSATRFIPGYDDAKWGD